MARPPKERTAKKTTMVKFRTTDGQKLQLDQLAFDAGLTISDLILSKVLGESPKRRKASPERANLIRRLNDLSRIGNNINQIARALNSGHGMHIPPNAISEALSEVKQLSNRIFKEFDQT